VNPLYMLDTNICIYIAREKPPSMRARFSQFRPGQLVMSAITHGELAYGAAKSADRSRALSQLESLVHAIPVESLSVDVSKSYGAIRAALEIQGRVIGNNDLWIAAHALALDLPLATTNEREFRRVPGLSVENWMK
jgi:tRNA(fMet)-specific endonuclease VapC